MREIKFRSWLKDEKSMNYNFTILNHPQMSEDEEHILMQYAGLKDKNGREIYEGDIVTCSYMGFKIFLSQVKFGEYNQDGSGGEYSPDVCIGFYAEAINKDQTDDYGFRLINECLETTSLLSFETIEVIGNIYENPELLE